MDVKIVERKPQVQADNDSVYGAVLARIFAARGVHIDQELDRPLSKLLPYTDLQGITEAISVLVAAMDKKQKIVVLGDFDTDGATSTALFITTMRKFGYHNVDFIIPNRFEHGYGLSPKIAEVMIETHQPDVVVTVDNGISSIEGVAYLKAQGVQVVITDHHLYSGQLPNADAIVNPNQAGCTFASKNLAGVGVVFYLMVGLRKVLHTNGWFERVQCSVPSMKDQLDLVALGTVADVVKLDANNRILIHHGLEVIRQRRSKIGLSALLALGRRDQSQILASDLSYCIGPRLNAAGRLSDMSIGVRCLITENPIEADSIADKLNQLNIERRQIEIDMQDQAQSLLGEVRFNPNQVEGICLCNPEWHQGVIGILASRVKEQYHRPTIIFTQGDEGELKGSGRSLAKLNIRDAICDISVRHPGLVLKFGGHAMAAGLSIVAERFEEFVGAFNTVVSEKLTLDDLNSTIFTDGPLNNAYLKLDFARQLRKCGPWGQGFPEPIFEGTFVVIDQRIVGNNHLKMIFEIDELVSVNAILFNADTTQWPNEDCDEVRVAYKLDINEYRGRQQVQLIIEHIEPVYIPEFS
jgi:single-stranded-DNA-specific exonuclease